MSIKLKHKKLNHQWDRLLSPRQRELLIKPGLGFSSIFPYMNAEDVKFCMDQITEGINNVEEMIREKYNLLLSGGMENDK